MTAFKKIALFLYKRNLVSWNKYFVLKTYRTFNNSMCNNINLINPVGSFCTGLSKENVEFPKEIYNESQGQIPMIIKEIKKIMNSYSLEDVEALKTSVLVKGSHITAKNFDAVFIALCGKENAFQLGKSYFEYIHSHGNNNIGVIGKFFRLCYDCREQCCDSEKNLMYYLFDDLLKKYEILDFKTCENVALGLSITEKWKECLKLLKMSRFTSCPSSKMYSAIIESAFDNLEIDMALNLLKEMMSDVQTPSSQVFVSWLRAYSFSRKCFSDIFNFFKKYDFNPSEELVNILLNYYKTHNSTPKFSEITTISPSGKCRTCSTKLSSVSVSYDEFVKLKNAFLDPVLIGRDIFLKTEPSELKSFITILNKVEKMDFVLDGLNIALSPTNRNYNVKLSAGVLYDVVKYFVSREKRILVLGRKHMNSWPKEKMNYIKEKALLFLVENESMDDPFLLYATMYFGLGTCFVSRDQMRNHKFLLKDPGLKSIFEKWKQQHQYYFLYASQNGQVSLKGPIPYLQSVQETRKGVWHIPLMFNVPGIPAHIIPSRRKWLCFHEN